MPDRAEPPAVPPAVPLAVPRRAPAPDRMPAIYLGHGAPTLLDDPTWPAELAAWSGELPRPRAILTVSAHWQSAPLTLGATTQVPLVYDFYGFPERYYDVRYDSPGAPELAARIKALMRPGEEVVERPDRGLDHGAYVPLIPMYPEADIPVLQMSMPDLAPAHLFEIGRRLAPLRDEGVLIVGSGFMTHGLARPGGRPRMVGRVRPLGGRDPRAGRPRRSLRLPQPRPRDALRPPDGRAFRAALRRPRRGDRSRRGAHLHDRGLLARAREALLPGSLRRSIASRRAMGSSAGNPT